MAFEKTIFEPRVTKITAAFLNALQDELIRVGEALEQPSGTGGSSSQGGLSNAAVNLLIEILESAVYNTNVSGKIAMLKEALASGGSSGGETPDVPDVPDEPVADDITVADGSMTIVTVGSEISVSDGVMTIA